MSRKNKIHKNRAVKPVYDTEFTAHFNTADHVVSYLSALQTFHDKKNSTLRFSHSKMKLVLQQLHDFDASGNKALQLGSGQPALAHQSQIENMAAKQVPLVLLQFR